MPQYDTVVTYLALEAAQFDAARLPATRWPDRFSLTLFENPPLPFYREIYDRVGRDWRWVNRRHLSDAALAKLIHHPKTRIYVLWDGDRTAGYVELNFRNFPVVEIVFVGLTEAYIGQGLGTAMLRATLEAIMQSTPARIIIQTCTLDHPNALRLYQRAGFVAYDRKTGHNPRR